MVQAPDSEELKVFLDELNENLAFLDDAILNLEENPDDKETLEEIFRVAHTIKGSASFLGLKNLVELGHSMENVFMEFHKGGIAVTRDVIDTVLSCKDAISAIGHALGKGEDTDHIEVDHLIEKVNAFLQQSNAGSEKVAASPSGLPTEIEIVDDCTVVRVWISHLEVAPSIRAFLVHKNLSDLGEILKQEPDESYLDSEEFQAQEEREIRYWFQAGVPKEEIQNSLKIDLIERVEILEDYEIEEYNKTHAAEATKPKKEEKVADSDKKKETKKDIKSRDKDDVEVSDNVRIPVSRLDTLLNLVGELVITNSGFLNVQDDIRTIPGFDATFRNMRDRVKELFRISADIQELVMKSRLVPVGQVFHRFKRFVRDYSGKSDKMIQFQTVGDDTEIDKMIIDEMIKPLTHMVRNSLDHGLETVQERLKAGKPEAGVLTLSASQEGNYINISIADDGHGLDVQKLKQKALSKGLIGKEEAEKMSDEQARQLIFQQGFSTKEAVDEMSGRGVGMDVVKRSVELLNGTILVDSTFGKGTKITIKLPLTLAILNALIVQVGQERFCIPMASIIETQKVSHASFITVEGHEMVRLRNQLIPLIDLAKIFEQQQITVEQNSDEVEIEYDSSFDSQGKREEKEFPVIVVEYNDNLVGFLVDQFISRQEMVIKSLAEHFRPIDGISGASILGDGTIILILDVHGVIQLFRAYKSGRMMQAASAAAKMAERGEISAPKLYSEKVQAKMTADDPLPKAIQLDENEKLPTNASFENQKKFSVPSSNNTPMPTAKSATPKEAASTPKAKPPTAATSKTISNPEDQVSNEDIAQAFPSLADDDAETSYIVPEQVSSPLSQGQPVSQEPTQEQEAAPEQDETQPSQEEVTADETKETESFEDDTSTSLTQEEMSALSEDLEEPQDYAGVEKPELESPPADASNEDSKEDSFENTKRIAFSHHQDEESEFFEHTPEQLHRLQKLFDPSHIDMLKDWLRQGNSRAIQGIQQLTGNINIRMGKSKAKRIQTDQMDELMQHLIKERKGSIAFVLPILPLNGVIFFLLTEQSAHQMVKMLWKEMNLPEPDADEEMDFEPLMEVTNIIGSSYTNSLSQVSDATVEPGIPARLEGRIKIEQEIQKRLDSTKFKILYVENQFLWEREDILAELLIMLPSVKNEA